MQPAGKWVKLVCQRHLRDRDAAVRGEGPYRWRPELADNAFWMFGLFRHYKGEWGGQPVRLEPWQKFVVGSIFGWVHRDTNLRRYRTAFCELTRGSGKSTMAAGLLLLLTFLDKEPGADGFVVATKRDQAKIVFRATRQMAMRSSELKSLTGIRVKEENIHDIDTVSRCEPLGADFSTLDGLRPHIVIADEVHQHASPELIGVMVDGMGTRRQPLLFAITTAGEDESQESVYGQYLNVSQQVLEGAIDIPTWFSFIACADPEDDWTLEDTWRKANPNWGISVKPEHIREKFQIALVNPAEQARFKRVYLGLKVQASDAYLSLADWDACPALPAADELAEYPSWIGLDLSSTTDITAAVQVWMLSDDEIAIEPYFWLPEDDLLNRGRRDRVPYEQWVREGYLRLTVGNTIDRPTIRKALVPLSNVGDMRAVCYDPWQAQELAQDLQDEDGVRMVKIPQTAKVLSDPAKALQTMILRRRVRHGQNPIMRWMVSNMAVKVDEDAQLVKPSKKLSRARIDGVQALITALQQVTIHQQSKYERGGLESVGVSSHEA